MITAKCTSLTPASTHGTQKLTRQVSDTGWLSWGPSFWWGAYCLAFGASTSSKAERAMTAIHYLEAFDPICHLEY